jgi:hypothetical protein
VLRAALFALALLAAALPLAAPSGASTAPTFRLVDAGSTGSELNVGVAQRSGEIFVGGWDTIARSTDDGASWSHVTLGLPVGFAADRVLIVDHATDRVFEEDTTLGCTILSWTDDAGATWTTNPVACGGGVTDHAKVAVGKRATLADPTGALYPNVVYVCGNGLVETDCGASLDGGLAFVPVAPHGIGCAFQGVPVSDAAGTLYEPSSACGLQVRTTSDNGLMWQVKTILFAPSPDTPSVAVTPDGAQYVFFTDASWHPALARSLDGGARWTEIPVPVANLTSAVFPTLVAGTDGRIALAFYATTDDASGWDHNPGNAPDAIRWQGYEAIVTDAESATPTVQPIEATAAHGPLQYGCLSKLGASCLDNIADYMGADVGPDGRVYAVFVDGCRSTCTDHATSTAEDALVSVETSGPTLR